MPFLIAILSSSIVLGFLLARFSLKIGVAAAILIPFTIVFFLNLLGRWFGPSISDAPMAEVAYFTLSIPVAVVSLLSLWVFRKFTKA